VVNVDEGTQTTKHNKRTRLSLAGLIVGLLGTGLDAFIIWSFAGFGPLGLVIPIIILGGIVALAWKKPFIGGILLIVFSLPTVPPCGLPLLVAGILFLLSWRDKQKQVAT
jgi:hypothetical protein